MKNSLWRYWAPLIALPALALCQDAAGTALTLATSWAAVLTYIAAALGGIFAIIGLIVTAKDMIERRPGAGGYLVFFALALVLPGILIPVAFWVLPYPADMAVAVICDLLLAAAAIGFFVYLDRRGAKPERRCDVCGNILLDSWTSCPFCKPPEPVPQTQQIEVTRPPDPTPISVPRPGNKTEILKPKEKPVLAFVVVKEGVGVNRPFPIEDERTTIGKDGLLNKVVIDDDTVSAQHCAIVLRDKEFYIMDLASTNGTFMNPKGVGDTPIDCTTRLADGDIIGIGRTRLVFKRVV